jgi:hypothetical protein
MKAAQIAFAAVVLAVALVYELMAVGMPRGSLGYPGPGFFPVAVGGFLLLAAAGCLVQACRSRPLVDGATPLTARPPAHKAGALVVLLVAYGLVLKPLGFPAAIFLFVLAAIRLFGYRRWLTALPIAAALTVASHVAFVLWLKVPLPMGVLAELLE